MIDEVIESGIGIGDRIRVLRMSQNRTLQEIADQCGLSKSMISKIENNRAVPSVAALVKIAGVLGTNIAALIEQNTWLSTVLTRREKAESNLTPTEKGYSIYPFASDYPDKKIQPFLFVAKRDEVKPHSVTHEGEEFVYVLKGEMKMRIAEVEYHLKPGDSLYFNALQKHGIMPVTDEVSYLDLFV